MGHGDRVEPSGTGRVQIERGNRLQVQPVLQDGGRRGHGNVGGCRGDDHGVDVLRRDVRFANRLQRRAIGHVGRFFVLAGPTTLANSGDLIDVFLADFREVLDQLRVGHDALGQIAAEPQECGRLPQTVCRVRVWFGALVNDRRFARRDRRNPIAHCRIVGLDLHDRVGQGQCVAFEVEAANHQTVAGGLEIEDRLGAVDLHERLTLIEMIAFGHVPFDDRGLDLRRALGRQVQRHLEQRRLHYFSRTI